jgi:hypothetical protein
MPITVKHLKVSTVPDAGDDTLVEPSDWNADHTLTGLGTMAEQNANAVAITGGTISGVTIPASNVTGTLGVPNGGTGATTLTGYVKGTGTTAMTASSTIPNTDITGLGTASTKDAGAANGVATLDAGGKVPVSELPAAVLGALSYQGTWDASTNTPTLTSSVGTKGYYYVVSVAGNTNLNGITDWLVGDWAIYNGSIWQKVDNTETVTSVNGQTGAVILTTTNVAEGTNLYYTDARARGAVSAGTGISYNSTTGVITNSSPSLGGDVVGPTGATDNAVARFDTTTGKLIQNSTVTINDNGTIEAVNGIAFDTTPISAPTAEGSLSWNSSDGTLDLVMKGGNVVQQIGEEQYYTVRNETGSTIANGTPVMANGVTSGSGRITVTPAIANGSIDELRFIGLTTESITNGINGYVTSFGYVRGLDTRGTPYGETWAEGDFIYVSPTTAGYLTNVEPTAPNLKIVVAIVITRNQTSGVLLVRPTAYPHITHLSDVNISSPASGNTLIYDAVQGRWENASITGGTGLSVTNGAGTIALANTGVTSAVAGTGISVSGATGAVTVTNTAPDQTVVLTAGTGISTSGTYPSFTVTNTAPDQTVALSSGTGISVTGTYPNFTVTNTAPSSGGTVTSVTGTAPVVSSGGNTPAISMAAATGSVDGYLTSTDWTTFNGKAPAVTYTTNYVPFGQGTTTPNLSASFTYTTGTGALRSPAVEASNGLVVNNMTIATSYSIPSGYAASSVGPVVLSSGVTITVPSGSRWVVL